MTSEEEELFPDYDGINAKKHNEPEFIAIRRDVPSDKANRIIRHEMGHSRYKIEGIEEAYQSGDRLKYNTLWLLDELSAIYYGLKRDTKDRETREYIKDVKKIAKEDGLSDSQISGIDELARNRVGYKGGKVD